MEQYHAGAIKSAPLKLLFLLFLFIFFFSCLHQVIGQTDTVKFRIEEYGAKVNDNGDDSDAFLKLWQEIRKGKYKIVLIQLEKGVYDIDKRINFNGLSCNIEFTGTANTIIRIRSSVGFFISSEARKYKLAKDALHGDQTITLTEDVKNIDYGDIVHIQSNSKFESAWNYKENDIQIVGRVQKDNIIFKDSILFNYEILKEKVDVVIYKRIDLSFRNIEFILAPYKDSVRTEAVQMRGVRLLAENISVKYNGRRAFFHNGFSISASAELNFKNIRLNNLMYGVLINFCRDISAEKTRAYYTRHAYSPSAASVNIRITDLYGYKCHSVMDAHAAFNVLYENVVDTLTMKYPDCRALGTHLKNVRIYPGNNDYQLYCYWSVQSLEREYRFLYWESDQIFENVEWVGNAPGRLNGINSYSCRTLIVKNCKTHSVSYYGGSGPFTKIIVVDSEVGLIYNMIQNTKIENVIMNGKLIPKTKFVFRFGGSGPVEIINTVVKNYNPDSTNLFDLFHNQPKSNSLTLKNVSVQKLKAWTNKLVDPGVKYTTLTIENSRMQGFQEEIPIELKHALQF